MSSALEEQLLAWLDERKAAGEVAFRSHISERALELAAELGIDKFNASSGWLDRFMTRHKLTADSIPDARNKGGEGPRKRAQNPTRDTLQLAIPFLNNVHRIRYERKYLPSSIYAITETGFVVGVVKSDPDSASSAETAADQRHVLRFRVLLGARADGFKLKPLLVLSHSEALFTQLDKFNLFFRIYFGAHLSDEHVSSYLENEVAGSMKANAKLVVLDAMKPRLSQLNETLASYWNLQPLVIPGNCKSGLLYRVTFPLLCVKVFLICSIDGLTKELNPVTVAIVEPLRKRLRALSEQWRESATLDSQTTMEHVCLWLTAAWSELSASEIAAAFKRCGISSALDGSEDHLVAPLTAAQRSFSAHAPPPVAEVAATSAAPGRYVARPIQARSMPLPVLPVLPVLPAAARPISKRVKLQPSSIVVWSEEAETTTAADHLAAYYDTGDAWTGEELVQ